MPSGTLVRRVLLQVAGDDADAEAKLDKISLKADELAAKHPELKVRIDTAAASAKVAVLRQELKGLSRQADEEAAKGGLLSRLFGGSFSGGFRNGFAALIPGLSGGGGSVTAAGEEGGTSLLGTGAGGLTALPLVAGAIGAAVTEAGALVTALSAAGLGVGGFAALAMPAFTKVHGAMSQIQADQQAYDRALTSKERQTAMAHLKQDWASMDPAERGAVKGVQQLTGEFGKMSKAFESTAFKVFGEGLKIANQLLPYVGQFAQAAAPAIEQVLSGLSRAVGGSGFKGFMGFLESLSGPVIKAVGSGMAGLAKDVVRLMESFSKKDVINSVNIAFRLVGAGLEAVIAIVKGSMHAWDQITMAVHETAHAFDVTRHAVASFAHGVAHDFDVVRHATAEFGHDWAHYFDVTRHAVAELGHDTAVWFDRIRHDIAQWTADVRSGTDRVVGWFRGLPGRIVHAVGDLGGLLFGAGRRVIQGLIDGIGSMIGGIGHAIGGIVGEIRSFLPFSPAKKGPLSGAGAPVNSGLSIVRQLADGIEAGTPRVRAAMTRVTGTVAAGRPAVATAGAAAAAQQPKVTIQLTGGDREFRIWLKKSIRVTGGNVQVVGA